MTERQLVAHLLRRAGFGATPAELDAYTALGFDGAVDRILNYQAVDNSAMEAALAAKAYDLSRIDGCQNWWLFRMLNTARPLEEKMTLFWHGHFASTNEKVDKPPYMLVQNQLFRQNALGGFADLVLKVSQDPAMLLFLDGVDNVRRHPNENYARELMELFTLGIGNYTETDVREGARALTGWTIRSDRFYVDARNHDTGTKTYLGQTGNWDGTDVCRIVTSHPACATFIATKLIHFFVTDSPSPDYVTRVADAFRSSGLSIRSALETIFRSPEFRDPANVRALIKSPVEFAIGFLKHLQAALPTDLRSRLREMQQELFEPPGVQGWVGAKTWVSSTTFLYRANWVRRLTSALDPTPYASGSNAQIVDRLADLFLDGEMTPAGRQYVVDWLSAPNVTSRRRRLRGAMHLIATTSTYQLN